jgi:serine protease Do
VIVDPDGFILTCRHVVDRAKRITVRLADGRSFEATVTGSDERTDLAVLKVDAADLPAVTWGDSDRLSVGQPVVAIGHPMGEGSAVSFGIVSGLHGRLGQEGHADSILTDAAIGSGYSGGPLVTLRGEVVGIAAATTWAHRGAGLGIVTPANAVRRVLADLMAGRPVPHAYLGAALLDVMSGSASIRMFTGEGGALVAQVAPDSPAAEAELAAGDIITEFNGQPVESANHLRRLVAASQPGTTARLRIWRDRAYEELTVTLGTPE